MNPFAHDIEQDIQEETKAESIAAEEDHEYLECEKRHVFFILMFVGGFYGAFTFSIRGGVFCNAQTANFVLLAMALGNGNLFKALYYLVPMSAYLFGTILSEALPSPIKKHHLLRWDTILIGIECGTVFLLGLLPESAPFQITQITINILTSMQYNTFRQARGIPMATTFCTNHIRQVGIHLVKSVKHKENKKYRFRVLLHAGMLAIFVCGAVISTFLCNLFLGKAIWFALIPLGILFLQLLYADLYTEKEVFDHTPKGH